MKLRKIYEDALGVYDQEHVSMFKTHNFHFLIPYVEHALNIDVRDKKSYLGSGGMSDTFHVAGGRVLKFTISNFDAVGLEYAMHHNLDIDGIPIIPVYDIYRLPVNSIPSSIWKRGTDWTNGAVTSIYIAIVAKATDTHSLIFNDSAKIDALKDEFKKYGLDANDLHPGNIGKYKGTWVYIDPHFRNLSLPIKPFKILKLDFGDDI